MKTQTYNTNLKLFKECTNAFGNIDERIKKRIVRFLNEPTVKNWDNIFSICISGFGTIWQAVVKFDDTFPKTGRRYDENNVVVKEWERIPEPWEVLRAIQMKIKEKTI